MKRVFALTMLLALVVTAYSQEDGLENQTYFRFGYSVPTWKYYGLDGKSDWNGLDTKKGGGLFEVGSIFYINSLKIAPGMRLGVNVDYLSINYHRIKSKSLETTDHLVFVGTKVGPSFSYCPVQRLTFDAFFKLNPIWVDTDISETDLEGYEGELYIGFLGLKYSLGVNVRYSVLMLGFEFNPGFGKFRYYDKEANELTDEFMGNAKDNRDRTPVPSYNITLGLSF